MSGTVNIARDLFEHGVFKDEPFSEREAWVWMIMAARWKSGTVRVGDFVVELGRGEFAASVRFMAGAWGWTAARVQRYLERLKKMEMICVKTDTGVSVISVCNYEKFQSSAEAADTGPIQDRYRTDTNKKKDVIRKEKNIGDFDAFWAATPKKVGKDKARASYLKALEKTDAGVLLDGMRAYAASRVGQDDQYTAHPASWLNAGRWNDAPQAPSKPLMPEPGEMRVLADGRTQSFDPFLGWIKANV